MVVFGFWRFLWGLFLVVLSPASLMLSYDDVTLRPKYSDVRSRNDVDLSTQLGGFKLSIPMMTANMDTVTESEMAVAVWKAGGVGALHRFMSPEYNVI